MIYYVVFDAKVKRIFFYVINFSSQVRGKSLQKGVAKVHQECVAMGKEASVKDRAPDFEAESTWGTICLADYHGKKYPPGLLLYKFYWWLNF